MQYNCSISSFSTLNMRLPMRLIRRRMIESPEIASTCTPSNQHGDCDVIECETEAFLTSQNSNASITTSKRCTGVHACSTRPLRILLCFGAVLVAAVIFWQFFRVPRDQSLYADVVHQVNNSTTETQVMSDMDTDTDSDTANFDFISNASAYFTPDYPTHKLIQIQNYKSGKSLIVNFHITNHAGTTLCSWARANGPVAPFACMGGNVTPPMLKRSMSSLTTPWYYNETDYWIRKVRPVFHYISWEYDVMHLKRSLNDTNWDHPNLVSIIVMRNPIDRLLSQVGKHHVKNGTSEEWWNYAQNIRTNNYALRTIMSYEGCCNGENTRDSYLKAAKSYLQRFTFVIDMDCFDESLKLLSSILGLHYTSRPGRRHPSARERMHNDTLYEYLVRRNTKDIELYEWAKNRSLVKCQGSMAS